LNRKKIPRVATQLRQPQTGLSEVPGINKSEIYLKEYLMSCYMIFCVSAITSMVSGIIFFTDDDSKILFQSTPDDSTNKSTQVKWRSVNDNVMGGLSEGRAKINNDKNLEFYGKLSLENNGGFASIRTIPTQLNLKKDDTIVIRVKGDGRSYFLNLYIPSKQIAFSYRSPFQTKKDQWLEIQLPIKDFYATSFGRKVNVNLDINAVNSIGLLLSDKKSGEFNLKVDWIKVGKFN